MVTQHENHKEFKTQVPVGRPKRALLKNEEIHSSDYPAEIRKVLSLISCFFFWTMVTRSVKQVSTINHWFGQWNWTSIHFLPKWSEWFKICFDLIITNSIQIATLFHYPNRQRCNYHNRVSHASNSYK